MGWKERLDRLPIRIEHNPLESIPETECLMESVGRAQVIATRNFSPTGVVYTASFFGEKDDRNALIIEFNKELGASINTKIFGNIWFYVWQSDSQEIPQTPVHRILGARFDEICQKAGLNMEERQYLNFSIAVISATKGMNLIARTRVVTRKIEELPQERRQLVSQIMLQIMQEFHDHRQPHPDYSGEIH